MQLSDRTIRIRVFPGAATNSIQLCFRAVSESMCTTEFASVTVEYKEDGRLKCVSAAKSWKLQKMDEDASADGDTELQFSDLREGDAVMAYWSPNRPA